VGEDVGSEIGSAGDAPVGAERLVDGLAFGLSVGDTEGLSVGSAFGLLLGDAEGLSVGSALGLLLGDAEGLSVGSALGLLLGDAEGLSVRPALGLLDGNAEGLLDRLALGLSLGDVERLALGLSLGPLVEDAEGLALVLLLEQKSSYPQLVHTVCFIQSIPWLTLAKMPGVAPQGVVEKLAIPGTMCRELPSGCTSLYTTGPPESPPHSAPSPDWSHVHIMVSEIIPP